AQRLQLGLLAVGGEIRTPDQLAGRRGGFGPVTSPRVARELPGDVVFRTPTESYGREYAFALRDGRLHVRLAREGRAQPGEPWHVLELPACLDGRITAISADHRLLVVLDEDRQVYAHDMPGGDLSPERWTWRWGPYFWTGAGARIPRDVTAWAASEFTSAETFTDTSGRRQHPIGVATVYLLRAGGRRITYIDPWLPADESREVCGPRRGTVALANLSASGSTVFAVSRRGELFTRLYDFDTSGANTVFGRYSWQTGRPAEDTRWQLPGPDWVRHRRPLGTITDHVSIAKTGTDAADRVLRVAGRSRRGRAGWWEKPLAAPARAAWRFVATGGAPSGRPLSWRGRPPGAPAPEALRYAGTIAGAPAEVRDLHPECSPATLRVHVAPDLPLDLVLHTSDGLRQETRAAGLDGTPREYNGALEIPAGVFATLGERDPRLRAWVAEHLGGRRISTAPVAVTRTRLRFLAQCWELTRDGRPAAADRPRVPPDLGALVGRVTEQQQDGRAPAAC
ncbi:MAG TPA: hypothetical protein VD931_13980, partial [Baekduia sp.]|nr:hypothetical protein [Baekduia sp.]